MHPYKTQEVHLIGDDILGIPGAFLEAGARSILVSIPLADDEASFEFMVEYHKHRLGNKSPLNALQATQIDMLQKPHFPIHLWIGFTIYGIQ